MVEAQEPPAARAVEIGRRERRLELARLVAAGDRAAILRAFDPAMPSARLRRHRALYRRDELNLHWPGRGRNADAPPDARACAHPLELIDDSEQHRGHGGYNPAGESHFSLRIESPAFAGKSRVERQRMVYAALGDLMDERVHALSIRASAPGEK